MALRLLRWITPGADAAPESLEALLLQALLTEIRQLNSEQTVGLARALAILWDRFVGRFVGLDKLLQADAAERKAYFAELQSAADEMGKSEALVHSRYALSPRLMLAYLQALSRGDNTAAAREFGEAVATLIDQGGKLRAIRGVNGYPSHSLSSERQANNKPKIVIQGHYSADRRVTDQA